MFPSVDKVDSLILSESQRVLNGDAAGCKLLCFRVVPEALIGRQTVEYSLILVRGVIGWSFPQASCALSQAHAWLGAPETEGHEGLPAARFLGRSRGT